jgi:Sulfotransferase family
MPPPKVSPNDPLLSGSRPQAENVAKQPVRVLYVAGFGRSGSTLLDRLLGSASRLHSGGEIGGIWTQGLVDDRLCSCGVRFSTCPFWQEVGRNSFSSLQARQIDAIVQYTHLAFPARRMWWIFIRKTRRNMLLSAPPGFWDLAECLYTAMRDVSGRQVVVDSSKLATYLVMLAHVSGVNVHVVHLVRDPRAVAYSWLRPRVVDPDGRTTMPRFGTFKSALLWVIMNAAVEWVAFRMSLPYVRVRYEDLVKDPAGIVGQLQSDVLRGAGLEFDEGGHLDEEDIDLEVLHSISGNPMRFHQGRTAIVEDAAWKSGPRGRRGIVGAVTFPLRWRYGYRGRP